MSKREELEQAFSPDWANCRQGVIDGAQEKSIYNFCGKHADWWPSKSQVKEMVVLLQKDWVGLTDDERMALFETAGGLNNYAKAIEAKLKEKNI